MRSVKRALVLVLMTAIPLAAHAGQAKSNAADRAVTVEEFAVMLATARGGVKGQDAGKAVELMVRAGVPLPADGRQPLTEKSLAEVLDFYGVNVKAGSDRAVTPAKAAAALLAVGGMLSATAKGAAPAPSASLDDCLVNANHGQCVNCCKVLLGSATSCAKFCFSINKPSASEPLP